MPASRLIADLEHLITELGADGPVAVSLQDELRLTVARVNELRRQLAIAQLKLTSVLSLAGMQDNERQAESGAAPHIPSCRFVMPEEAGSGIAALDEAHRAMFQAGNRLYWLALQHNINAKEVDEALAELVQCAALAFASEERMMEISGYPHFGQHREIHWRMQDYLSEMQELVAFQPLAVAIKLERLLGSWFLWHRQREDADFGKYHRRERSDLHAPVAAAPAAVVHAAPATCGGAQTERNPVRELGYLLRGQISSWLISWRERRHVAQTSRAILSQYRSIAASHPQLASGEVYRFAVMAHTGCDTDTANMILDRAEQSFAEWPVSRALKLRDVVHYLTVTEYLDRYGKDFWMRSKIDSIVAAHIPKNL